MTIDSARRAGAPSTRNALLGAEELARASGSVALRTALEARSMLVPMRW